MKKIISLALAAVLALGILSGCGKKADAAIQIAVPNDTTNEARALLLLEANGIMKIGYIVKKNQILSSVGKLYIEKIQEFLHAAQGGLSN